MQRVETTCPVSFGGDDEALDCWLGVHLGDHDEMKRFETTVLLQQPPLTPLLHQWLKDY